MVSTTRSVNEATPLATGTVVVPELNELCALPDTIDMTTEPEFSDVSTFPY